MALKQPCRIGSTYLDFFSQKLSNILILSHCLKEIVSKYLAFVLCFIRSHGAIFHLQVLLKVVVQSPDIHLLNELS